MMKKGIFTILACGLFLCLSAGCGNGTLTDEMVKGGQAFGIQNEENDIQAGSSYVESEIGVRKNRTFPTLSELKENVKEELGNHYWPEISISQKELEEMTGITEDMYVEFLAEEQIVDANIDLLIIIRAKEDHVGAIEDALESYRNRVIEENQKYPQNLGKAKASRMETIENYVCFVQLGADTTIIADKGEKEIIAYCQEENERAIDVLEKSILQSL